MKSQINLSKLFEKNNPKLILYCYRKNIIEFNLIIEKRSNEKNYENILYKQNLKYN